MPLRLPIPDLLSVLILSFRLSLMEAAAPCAPPPSVQCESDGCKIFNYQGVWADHKICKAANASFPKSEAELIQAVSHAVKNKQKIRIVSWLAHSVSKLACVESQGLIISTKNYASIIGIDKTAMTITVQAGAMMSDLMEAAAEQGLTLPSMINWNGVSAAGVISTGCHSSGLAGKGSGVYEYVVAMRLVVPASPSEGYAKVITLTEADEELKAARISLGMLGAISEITFALEAMYKRSVSAFLKDDDELENGAENFLRGVEFSDMYWFPSHRKALFKNMSRVSVDVPGDGFNAVIGIPQRALDIENDVLEMEILHANAAKERICKRLELQINSNGSGFFNGLTGFTGYPVVGFNHRMQASGGCQGAVPKPTDNSMAILEDNAVNETICNLLELQTNSQAVNGSEILNSSKALTGYLTIGVNQCMQISGGCQNSVPKPTDNTCNSTTIFDKNAMVCRWDSRIHNLLVYDVAIQVHMANLSAVIQDIKKIRDLSPQSLCDYRGILIRSIKKSEAYLGPAEDVAVIEMIYYRHRDGRTPKWNGDVYEEIEQMVVEKYGGVLHWGKTGGHLFKGQAIRAANMTEFLKVKAKFDPNGVFSNEWTDTLFGIEVNVIEEEPDGCALNKMCKCAEDRHCAPEKGYLCMPGTVWQSARVCRKMN